MIEAFDRRRRLVTDRLNAVEGVSCLLPKGAFYAFPNVKETGWKAKALASALLDNAGVATVGGPDFGTLGEGYIRLSCAASDDDIVEAIGRIDSFLNGTSEAATA